MYYFYIYLLTLKIQCLILFQVYSYRIVSKNSEVKSNTPNRDIIHVPKTTTPNPNSFTPQPPKRNESPLGKAYRDWGNLKYNLADRYDKLVIYYVFLIF